MTQFSFFWGCGATGDQGNVTKEKMTWANMLSNVAEINHGGVVYWPEAVVPPAFDTGVSFSNSPSGMLKPTDLGGGSMRIASGVGFCGGHIYINDDNIDIDCSTSTGSIEDAIVMQMDAIAATVRIVRKSGTGSGGPSMTKNNSIWEVPIAKVYFSSNVFSRFEDVRTPCGVSGSKIKIFEHIYDGLGGEPTFFSVPSPTLFDKVQFEFRGYDSAAGSGATDAFIDFGTGLMHTCYDIRSTDSPSSQYNVIEVVQGVKLGKVGKSGDPATQRVGLCQLTILNYRNTDVDRFGKFSSTSVINGHVYDTDGATRTKSTTTHFTGVRMFPFTPAQGSRFAIYGVV